MEWSEFELTDFEQAIVGYVEVRLMNGASRDAPRECANQIEEIVTRHIERKRRERNET